MNKTLEYALSEALELHTNHNLDYVKAKMIAIVRGYND